MDLNMLKQYMDFAKQNGIVHDYSNPNGFNPTPYNVDGAAAQWAMRMMQPQGEERADVSQYFGGQPGQGQGGYSPAAYTAPQKLQGQFQPPQGGMQPMTGQVNNYLANLMGRR